ncbi:hypothetical protein [Roseovarius sp.]|uniref:hypothetical protein n=1 Tax=Roseovarius sp. TaxID=1486281 RepID=UPI003A97630D
MADIFRPWGQLQWLMGKLPGGNWSFLGTLGTEDRCTTALSQLAPEIVQQTFIKIYDPHMSPAAAFEARFQEIEKRLSNAGLRPEEIVEADLLQDIDSIEEVSTSFIESASNRVVLDISSMPKRWFFPILRFLLNDQRVETLVVCYSVAERYGSQLSSDPLPLGPLPTFDRPRNLSSYEDLIVSVGFAPLGLKDLFEAEIEKIRYLFPFPPGPPNYFRNWDFLRKLESEVKNRSLKVEDRWQVHTFDLPDAFEALCRATNYGERTCALAPFGPKTHSLAMCLFALSAENAGKEPVHVYYTQPRRYALDYSIGVASKHNQPDTKAYCIKLNGRNLYDI